MTRIQLSDNDHCVLLFEGVVEVENPVVVQPGEQLHLSQRRSLLLGPGGNKLCGVLGLAQLLGHTFDVRKGTSERDGNQSRVPLVHRSLTLTPPPTLEGVTF